MTEYTDDVTLRQVYNHQTIATVASEREGSRASRSVTILVAQNDETLYRPNRSRGDVSLLRLRHSCFPLPSQMGHDPQQALDEHDLPAMMHLVLFY